MTFSVYSLSIIFSLIFVISILELIRRNKLLEKYSLLWILFGVIMLILSSTPLFIEKIALLLNIKYAPSVLFLFGFIFLIVYNLNITVLLSRQSQKITRLNQEFSIFKEKVENERKTNNS